MTEDVSATPAENARDQYSDGKAAKAWSLLIGDQKSRTEKYKNFLVGHLKERKCKRILDLACGTGVDSIMLIEEGFEVVSVDASDKMLKYDLKVRWDRRKEAAFDNWIIEEANWVTLLSDIHHLIGDGFDAVICLGNFFAHIMDSRGDQRDQKQAIRNFERCVKPGGLLLIDHRNSEHVINSGYTPAKSIYYNSKHETEMKTSVLYVSGKPSMVIIDCTVDASQDKKIPNEVSISKFRLTYYPHKFELFKNMLQEAFGPNCFYKVYGDFKEPNEIDIPSFYIHLVEKKKV